MHSDNTTENTIQYFIEVNILNVKLNTYRHIRNVKDIT